MLLLMRVLSAKPWFSSCLLQMQWLKLKGEYFLLRALEYVRMPTKHSSSVYCRLPTFRPHDIRQRSVCWFSAFSRHTRCMSFRTKVRPLGGLKQMNVYVSYCFFSRLLGTASHTAVNVAYEWDRRGKQFKAQAN